jgi:CBS-domain-containing membrane protein
MVRCDISTWRLGLLWSVNDSCANHLHIRLNEQTLRTSDGEASWVHVPTHAPSKRIVVRPCATMGRSSPVITVEPDVAMLEAIRIVLERRISGLPVIDSDGRLVGMLTEGDFLRRIETGTQRRRPRWLEFLVGPGRLADEYTRSHARKVGELMTREPVIVGEDTLCTRSCS